MPFIGVFRVIHDERLLFLGRLPKAKTAVLVLNENGQADSEYTNTPSHRINLPRASLEGGQG